MPVRPALRSTAAAVTRHLADYKRRREETAVDELRDFITLLSADEVDEHASDLLPDILQEADRLGLDRARLARGCKITEPSISRWVNRKAQPAHNLIAQAVVRTLRELAAERLAALSGETRKRRSG